MNRKAFLTTIILIISTISLFGYGKTGHRVIAEVAKEHLSCRAKCKIKRLLGDENLILVANFADDIKSDKKYNYAFFWHFVNLKAGQTYEESKKNPKGDLITAYKYCVKTLKDKKASVEDKRFCLKFLVHIVGDLHQPLHIGHAEDRGGNDIKVKWFGKSSNLHKVWDSQMLDFYKMSYTELAENMPKLKRKKRKQWESGDIYSWVEEMRLEAEKVYQSVKKDEDLRYRYMYDHFENLRTHLHKGGVRLAKVLNDIF